MALGVAVTDGDGVGDATRMLNVRDTGAAARYRVEPELEAVIVQEPALTMLMRPNMTAHTVRVLLTRVTGPAGALATSS